MRRTILIAGGAAVLLILIFLVGRGMFSGAGELDTLPISDEPAKSMIIAVREENASGESGKAVIVAEGGKTRLTLELTGVPESAEQPAHLHAGVCGELKEVKYSLEPVKGGRSETILSVAFRDLLAQWPLAVGVHRSADELQTFVACGELIGNESPAVKPVDE